MCIFLLQNGALWNLNWCIKGSVQQVYSTPIQHIFTSILMGVCDAITYFVVVDNQAGVAFIR